MVGGAFTVGRLDLSDGSVSALVYSSWIKAQRAANDRLWAEWRARKAGDPPLSNGVLCAGLHNSIERMLVRPGSSVVGATLNDDPGVVLGFAACESCESGPVLHWVSVKEPFRRYGVARAMLEFGGMLRGDEPLRISARTQSWASFAKHCGIRTVFDPFAM